MYCTVLSAKSGFAPLGLQLIEGLLLIDGDEKRTASYFTNIVSDDLSSTNAPKIICHLDYVLTTRSFFCPNVQA